MTDRAFGEFYIIYYSLLVISTGYAGSNIGAMRERRPIYPQRAAQQINARELLRRVLWRQFVSQIKFIGGCVPAPQSRDFKRYIAI